MPKPSTIDTSLYDWIDELNRKKKPIYLDKHRKELLSKLQKLRTKRSKVSAFFKDLFGTRHYEKMYIAIQKASEEYAKNISKTKKVLQELMEDHASLFRIEDMSEATFGTEQENTTKANLYYLKAYPTVLKKYQNPYSWFRREDDNWIVDDLSKKIPKDAERTPVFGYAQYRFVKAVLDTVSIYLNVGKNNARQDQIKLLYNKLTTDMKHIEGQESIAFTRFITNVWSYDYIIKNYGTLE